MGKPAPPFFEAALARLGATADQTFMLGDDKAAQALGIRGLLVKTGKFRAGDLLLQIDPFATLDSVAALPDWWSRLRSFTDTAPDPDGQQS